MNKVPDGCLRLLGCRDSLSSGSQKQMQSAQWLALGNHPISVARITILSHIKPRENSRAKIYPVGSLFVLLRINSDQSDLMFGSLRMP